MIIILGVISKSVLFFERHDYLFDMIDDRDDTHFEMIMTFILRGAGFYLS